MKSQSRKKSFTTIFGAIYGELILFVTKPTKKNTAVKSDFINQ